MNVASLENCKRLYELSGWDDDSLWFYCHGHAMQSTEFDTADFHQHYPAYDAGYLLRKLPHQIDGIYDLGLYPGKKYLALYVEPDGLSQYDQVEDTPENALCKLAIKLIEKGILNPVQEKQE